MNVFKSKLIAFRTTALRSCLTICQLVLALALSVSMLTGCEKLGLDPGDGSGGSTGDGGGGQGIDCRASSNPKLKGKLFVRDIYEAMYDDGREMKTIQNGTSTGQNVSAEAITVLTDSLKNFFGPSSHNIALTSDKYWNDFVQQISFIGDDKDLYPSHDANSPIALPKGCSVVQIAFWDESSGADSEGTLYVKRSLWNRLDQLNKVGLLAHEIVFKHARKALHKNSDATRHKVGELLSAKGLVPMFKDWAPSTELSVAQVLPKYKSSYKFCEGSSTEDPNARLQFYQYEDTKGKQRFAIPVLESNSINAGSLPTFDFSFDPFKRTDLLKATDLLIYQSDFSQSSAKLNTGLTPELFFELHNDRPASNFKSDAWRGRWIKRWYGTNNGFHSPELQYPQKDAFINLLAGLSKKQEDLWSDFITSGARPIKVTLLNPTFDSKSSGERRLKSKKDLTYTLQRLISTHLKSCDINWGQTDNYISSLNKEINEHVQAGTHPAIFPRWEASIRKLEDEGCKINGSDFMTDYFPALLYSLKVNNYDEEAFAEVLGDLAYDIPSTSSLKPGRVRVSQDNTSLTFDLTCSDFDSVYAQLKRQSEQKEIVRNKKINHTSHEDQYAAAAVNDLRSLERQISSTKALAKFLSFEDFSEENWSKFKSQIEGGACQSTSDITTISCPDFISLSNEIYSAKEMTVSACDKNAQENDKVAENNFAPICVHIDMADSGNRYQIYFTIEGTSVNYYPEIDFIRLVDPKTKQSPSLGKYYF